MREPGNVYSHFSLYTRSPVRSYTELKKSALVRKSRPGLGQVDFHAPGFGLTKAEAKTSSTSRLLISSPKGLFSYPIKIYLY